MSADLSVGNNNALIAPIYDKIPLSHLLEAAVQKTYHELFTMADVLQGKSYLERKVELIKFTCRARQLFIRILAVVKWAGTSEKVAVCEDIQNILELRARLIRQTSDSLAQLAREKLLDARVPNFPVTDAVDALTLGSVNFLPKRIAEITTLFEPANENERQEILPRLQQILTARISSVELPIQFTNVIIKNGIVTLIVEGEFEVKLGIINDNLTSPWHVYQTKLFLRDTEEPEQELVHPLQMQTLTNFIQSWLNDSTKPLVDLYQYLHYYCQVLRLQILFEQAHRIRSQGAKQKDLLISGYTACKSFNIEYWRDYSLISNSNLPRKSTNNSKTYDIGMTIQCDEEGKLFIQHWPPLPIDDSVAISKILEKLIFTMEEILNRTILARCQRRFEELKETISSTTIVHIEIDPSIPALICELLPESSPEEILFISISPFSGLFKVVSYMDNGFCQQIENALNRDQTNLIESINLFKIWLIQQRIPALLSHVHCRIYTDIPSLNTKNELIVPYLNKSIFIELIHNEGFYIIVYVDNINQLTVQYYLLIMEKRHSIHEAFVTQTQTINSTEEGAKWTLEPLLICPLDPTTFLRKELFEFKNIFPYHPFVEDDEQDMRPAQSTSIISLKSLVKFINYYDEMLSFLILKEDFQRKKTVCKSILYCPWTGIPYLDIVQTSTIDEDYLSSDGELISYINEYFWPRIQACTIRMIYSLRDVIREFKPIERQWILHLTLSDKDYFRNSSIENPYHAFTMISGKTYSKLMENIYKELRSAFEITRLFEDYSIALSQPTDLHFISKIERFHFFKSIIHYGPDFAFSVTLNYNSNPIQTDLTSTTMDNSFDFRFATINQNFFNTAHQFLQRKLTLFLNQTQSLKQFLRLLHITAIPLASIARLNCLNRPIFYNNQGHCAQTLLTFVPYTETRWRLIFGQIFALDIQICGPNLILVRDGSFSVQLSSSLNDHVAIPRLKEFLSTYADDRGLTMEFSDITDQFHEKDFLRPDFLIFNPPPASSSVSKMDDLFLMDETDQSPIRSTDDIYDVIFRDPLPTSTSNVRSDSSQYFPRLHSYNRELLTKANYPVYMTHETFFRMLYSPNRQQWSRLESFLASSILVRQFAKAVTEPADANNPTIRAIANEQDTYRIDQLSLQITFQFDISSTIYRICLTQQTSQANVFWSSEEIEALEIFLNKNFFPLTSPTNLVMPSMDILSLQAPQNGSTAMGSFERMLSLIQPRILKDLVKIIRLEQNPETHHLWQARWCITIPQGNGFSQMGQPAIYYQAARSMFLFMFQFTPRNPPSDSTPSSFIVPLTYDSINNYSTLWEKSAKYPILGNESKYQAITAMLTAAKDNINQNECSLYQTILDLITRLPVSSTS